MKPIKFVKQHDMKDCGAASLCMIGSFYGKKYSLRYMRELTHTGQNGVTMQGISEGAKYIGIHAEAFEATIDELIECLQEDQSPKIVHLKTNHFVVVTKAKRGMIFLSDPAIGRYRLTRERFAELWSGYVMMFTDLGSDLNQSEGSAKTGIISKTIQHNWKQICFITIISWLLLGISLCSAYLFQVLSDYGNTSKNAYVHDSTNPLIRLLNHFVYQEYGFERLFLFMIVLTIFMAALSFFRGKAVALLSNKMDFSFMDEYITKLFKARISDLSTRMTGDYITRTTDIASVRDMISSVFISFLINLNLFLAGSVLLLRINVSLFFIAMVTLFLYCLLAFALRRPLDIVYHAAMSANADMQTCLKESVQGIDLIKAYNIEDQAKSRLMKKHENYLNNLYQGNLLGTYGDSGSVLIEQISNLIILFAGFRFVSDYLMSLGELMTFFLLQSIINASAKQLLSMQQSFRNAVVAMERLNDVICMKDDPEGEITIDGIHEIRVENLGFSYFGRSPLFQQLSFSLKGNTKMAIIGKNGSGKSTILRLLMGMEKASSGHIYINGIDIDKIIVRDLRDRIAFVPQNAFLFADTLLFNITLGRDYSAKEISEACEMAGLSDFIRQTPQGLNLFIDENALNLSSGQKQSIAIARALIRKPDLLILDEATSNMDEAREKMVIEHLMSVTIPCIFVTHNRSIINVADFVIEIDGSA